MKLIEEGSFGDSVKKCVSLVWYILGPDSMDTMVIGFKEIGTVLYFRHELPQCVGRIELCIRIPLSFGNAIKGRRLL